MRVRVAEATALFWDQSRLVWDDYIDHRQHALSAESERVLRWFSDWRELQSIKELGDEYLAIAERLLDAGVLVAENSSEHAIEQQVIASWGPWGPAARYLHFASRTLAGTRFLSAAEDTAEMQRRAFANSQAEATPPPAKSYPDQPLIPLSAVRPDDSSWPSHGLLDALYRRRSTRRFGQVRRLERCTPLRCTSMRRRLTALALGSTTSRRPAAASRTSTEAPRTNAP
jgi:hypothetical protein